MSTEFKPPQGIPFHFEDGELPEPPESLGDRFGEFVPENAAQAAAHDRLPSHEDLLAREPRVELTEEEKTIGREEVEKAKRLIFGKE
jgi:hypothetical protein